MSWYTWLSSSICCCVCCWLAAAAAPLTPSTNTVRIPRLPTAATVLFPHSALSQVPTQPGEGTRRGREKKERRKSPSLLALHATGLTRHGWRHDYMYLPAPLRLSPTALLTVRLQDMRKLQSHVLCAWPGRVTTQLAIS